MAVRGAAPSTQPETSSSRLCYPYVIMIWMPRDRSLDTLLDLNGQVLVIDEGGYWVKFVVHQVPATAEKPHGLDDTLTMHGPDGGRPVGFDNAHPVDRAGQERRERPQAPAAKGQALRLHRRRLAARGILARS